MLELIDYNESYQSIMQSFYNEVVFDVLGIVNDIKSNRQDAYYSYFIKDPIDTGLSYIETEVTWDTKGTQLDFSFLIDVNINTQYASFFANPLSASNKNWKYGKRNTAEKMIEIFITNNNL